MMLYIVEQFDRLDNKPRKDFVRYLFYMLYSENWHEFEDIEQKDDAQGQL